MQALATARVIAVADPENAYVFERAGSGGADTLRGRPVPYGELDSLNAEVVVETGRKWQVVPAKLFRAEDRFEYLRGQYPLANPHRIGTARLDPLDAVGVFDRDPNLPAEVVTGHHLAQLLLDAGAHLGDRFPDHAVLFVVPEGFWLCISRGGRHAVTQAMPLGKVDDAVFYVAALLEQFGLSRETCPVLSGGLIAPGGQLFKQLTIYFDLRVLAAELSGGLGAPTALLLAYGRALRGE